MKNLKNIVVFFVSLVVLVFLSGCVQLQPGPLLVGPPPTYSQFPTSGRSMEMGPVNCDAFGIINGTYAGDLLHITNSSPYVITVSAGTLVRTFFMAPGSTKTVDLANYPGMNEASVFFFVEVPDGRNVALSTQMFYRSTDGFNRLSYACVVKGNTYPTLVVERTR